MSMDKIALWKNVHVDDWTAERAIIASNLVMSLVRMSIGAIYLAVIFYDWN